MAIENAFRAYSFQAAKADVAANYLGEIINYEGVDYTAGSGRDVPEKRPDLLLCCKLNVKGSIDFIRHGGVWICWNH